MTRLSPDEYADLLVARRDAYYVDHPPRPGFPATSDRCAARVTFIAGERGDVTCGSRWTTNSTRT